MELLNLEGWLFSFITHKFVLYKYAIIIDRSIHKSEIASYDEYSESKVSDIIQAVNLSQTNWNNVNLEFRLDCLNEMIGVLKDEKIEYSRLMAYEMGNLYPKLRVKLTNVFGCVNIILKMLQNFSKMKY